MLPQCAFGVSGAGNLCRLLSKLGTWRSSGLTLGDMSQYPFLVLGG